MSIEVYKLGSSVLRSPDDAGVAVAIARDCRERGVKALLVVSAFGDTTDRLARGAASFGEADPACVAALLATGERISAATIGLALGGAGLSCEVLMPERIGPRTIGEPLDARPVWLDTGLVHWHLRTRDVVVVPGFVGVDDRGRTTVLGRGGSDLSALFIADRLGATRCRLVKDVDGLYEWDPSRGASPARFEAIHWDDALAVGGGVVQAKGVRFARAAGLAFEVGLVDGAATVVGDTTRLEQTRRAA